MIEGGVYVAVPLDLSDPTKLTYILDRIVEHESYWNDFQSDPGMRRVLASSMLADALSGKNAHVHEVWRLEGDRELVGLIGYSNIMPRVNAQFHPLFFDGKLRNAMGKRELLLRSLLWAFQRWDLHRVSAEVPETAFALLDFIREKLGFRFEAEGRNIMQRRVLPHGHLKNRQLVPVSPSAREAEWGSRRFQALYQKGRWIDAILLSVTRAEFSAFLDKAPTWATSSPDPLPSKPSPAT